MQRIPIDPRPDWQEKVEELGLTWHGGSKPYWNEAAYYKFTRPQVLEIERATNELHQLSLVAVQHVIDQKLYEQLEIPDEAVPLIERSWDAEPPSLYGRFDLAYDGVRPPKLLEYNADTPTSLLEASVIQWYWLQERFPRSDQFNSLHDRLVRCWREFRDYLPGPLLHFCSLDDQEDGLTITYLEETARQAGYQTAALPIDEIGWAHEDQMFVGGDNEMITAIFKLYPWEWMVREDFVVHLEPTFGKTVWIEPAWKMILSNKGILPILWELNPGHANLLPAYYDEPRDLQQWVSKPLLSREGANIEVHAGDLQLKTEGEYDEWPRIYQEFVSLDDHDGHYPVVGSWIIGQEAGGMGIREATSPVTTNTSQFVPHLFG